MATRDMAGLAGGDITSTFDNPASVKLGRCKLIEEIMIGEDKLIHFSGVAMGEACTIVLRGASALPLPALPLLRIAWLLLLPAHLPQPGASCAEAGLVPVATFRLLLSVHFFPLPSPHTFLLMPPHALSLHLASSAHAHWLATAYLHRRHSLHVVASQECPPRLFMPNRSPLCAPGTPSNRQ